MSVPTQTQKDLRDIVWQTADELNWMHLTPQEKTRHYDNWGKDPGIGGVLIRYLDANQVHRYIKDSLMKGFNEMKISDPRPPMLALSIDPTAPCAEEFARPLGRCMEDGRVFAWGLARDWKAILLAVHERAFGDAERSPHGAAFSHWAKLFPTDSERAPVEDAAEKLGLEVIAWMDE